MNREGLRLKQIGQLGGAIRRRNPDSSRNRSTSAGTTTTAAKPATGTGTCSAPHISIGPAGAHASDTTGSVAAGTTREGTCHRFLVHDRFGENRSGQHTETRC